MKKLNVILLILVLSFSGCHLLNFKTIMNLDKLKFKLASVDDFHLMNISLSDMNSLRDLSAMDVINLTSTIASGKFPVNFTLNVAAMNPNQPASSSQSVDITLKKMPWKLLINGKETIAGSLKEPVMVRGTQTTIIPLQIELDLKRFFNDGGLDDLFNLALNLGGQHGSPSKLELIAEPTLGTPLGDMKYPTPLTIISKEFK